MVAGEIIADGTPTDVKADMKGSLSEIETNHPNQALAVLKKKFGASRVSLFGDRLHLVTETDDQKRDADTALREAGVEVLASKPIPFSLEDVFISLIESRRSEIPL
jgi:ABC-2 type transport system ATP-binding protein